MRCRAYKQPTRTFARLTQIACLSANRTTEISRHGRHQPCVCSDRSIRDGLLGYMLDNFLPLDMERL